MLKKLMKHEWTALGRMLFPLYGLLLLTAPLAGFLLNASKSGMMEIQTGNPSIDTFIQTALGMTLILLNILFFVEMIGVVVANLILVAIRFYKTMTGEEAYLTHTLPVTMHSLITSKMLIASAYEIISSLAVLAASVLYWMCSGNTEQISSLLSILAELIAGFSKTQGIAMIFPVIGCILLIILTIFATNLHIFASVALGHLITKHRVAGSFLMYVLINYAKQFITFILTFLYMMLRADSMDGALSNMPETDAPLYLLTHFEGFLLLITVLTLAILYYITHYVFTKRLNLD